MITRAMISFDIEKEGRWYHVLVPNGSPYAEVCDVMNEVIAVIEEQKKADMEKAAAEQQQIQNAAEV